VDKLYPLGDGATLADRGEYDRAILADEDWFILGSNDAGTRTLQQIYDDAKQVIAIDKANVDEKRKALGLPQKLYRLISYHETVQADGAKQAVYDGVPGVYLQMASEDNRIMAI